MMIFYEETPESGKSRSSFPWRTGLIVLCVVSFASGGYLLTGRGNSSSPDQAIIEQTSGTVARGQVTNFEGEPIEKATIVLFDSFGSPAATIITDFNGYYEARVSPGTYNLKAVSGNQEINKQIIVTTSGTDGGDVQLDTTAQ